MNRQYARSERAHFLCPQMHFGMILELDHPYIPEKMEDAWRQLARAHPFLRARMAYEGEALYYDIREESQVPLSVRDTPDTLWVDYAAIGASGWDLFGAGLLRVLVYPQEERMTVLLAAHHLLADGLALASLALEFADLYAEGRTPPTAEEHLIAGPEALPPGSALAGISRWLVRRVNRQWAKEQHRVDIAEYRAFERAYAREHPRENRCYTVSTEELADIHRQCREKGVTVNDWLTAQLLLRTGAQKVILASDLRRELPGYQPGALGNYATAFSVVSRSRSRDLWAKAREIHRTVTAIRGNNRRRMTVLSCYFAMDPGLLDAAAIAALGGFPSRAAAFVGRDMFGFGGPGSCSVTNLGKLENKHLRSLVFIPPASPATRLILGAVTLNGTLRVCTSERKS